MVADVDTPGGLCDDMPAFAVVAEADPKIYFTIAKFDDLVTAPVSIFGRRKDDLAVALPRPFVVLKHAPVQSTALLTRSQTAAASFTTSKASPRISEARRVNLDVFLISRLLSLLATYDPVNTEPSTETIIPQCTITIRRVIRSQVMSRSVASRSRPEVAGYRQRLES